MRALSLLLVLLLTSCATLGHDDGYSTAGHEFGPLPRAKQVVQHYLYHTSARYEPESVVIIQRDFPRVGIVADCEGWIVTMAVRGRRSRTHTWASEVAKFVIVHDSVIAVVWG